MSEDYYVYFENPKTRIDAVFLKGITDWIISKDFRYSSFWVAGDEIAASLDEAVERLAQGGSSNITFLYDQNNLDLCHNGSITLVSHPANFRDSPFVDLFIDVVKKMYFELKAERAYGTLALYSYSAKAQEAIKRPDNISWINIFNPDMVKAIGKEKLMRVQARIENPLKKNEFIRAYRAETLRDGSFLLVLTSYPLDASGAMCERLSQMLYHES